MAAASVLPHSSWRIDSAEIETNAVVLDLTSLEPVFGRTIDGIVGTDFLRRYAVELDPTDRQFSVYEAGTFQPTAQAVSIPLELDDIEYGGIQGSLYFGDKLAKGLFMVDTGLNGAVDVYRPFAQQHGLPVHPAEIDFLPESVDTGTTAWNGHLPSAWQDSLCMAPSSPLPTTATPRCAPVRRIRGNGHLAAVRSGLRFSPQANVLVTIAHPKETHSVTTVAACVCGPRVQDSNMWK